MSVSADANVDAENASGPATAYGRPEHCGWINSQGSQCWLVGLYCLQSGDRLLNRKHGVIGLLHLGKLGDNGSKLSSWFDVFSYFVGDILSRKLPVIRVARAIARTVRRLD